MTRIVWAQDLNVGDQIVHIESKLTAGHRTVVAVEVTEHNVYVTYRQNGEEWQQTFARNERLIVRN